MRFFALSFFLSFRLKEKNLNKVKIADFGLAEIFRPGNTLHSNRGTLSFQAPEILGSSSYAGAVVMLS